MALDTTVGGNDAESYVTLTECSDYMRVTKDNPDYRQWINMSQAEREFRLKIAALLMNQLPWRGAKASRNQRLEFPRWWRWDDEYPVDEDEYLDYVDITQNAPTTPQEVKDAQCEMAWQVVHNGILTKDELAYAEREIKSFGLGGSLEIEFFGGDPKSAVAFSKARITSLDTVYAYLGKWIRRVSGGIV